MICFGFSIQQHTHAHPVSIIPVLHYLSQEIQAGERAFSRWLQISLTASQFYTSAKEKKSKLNWAGYVHPRASQNRGRHTKKRGGEFLGAQPDSQTHRKIKCRVKASSIRWVFHSDTWKLWCEAASLRRGKHFKSKKTKQKPPKTSLKPMLDTFLSCCFHQSSPQVSVSASHHLSHPLFSSFTIWS